MAVSRSRDEDQQLDPPLAAVRTAYPTEPLLALFDPPIQPPSFAPCGHLHLDWRIDFSAVCFGKLL
jgi:hypothetical protein